MPMVREEDIFRFVRSYRTNDAFRIQVQLGQECYVYAFACDSASARPTLIFPDSAITLINYLQRDTLLKIPDPSGRSYCAFDSAEGTEYLCLVFSRGQVDVRTFFHDMECVAGSCVERVVSALGGDCVPWEEIESTQGEGACWWTLNKDRSIVALVFALTHVRS